MPPWCTAPSGLAGEGAQCEQRVRVHVGDLDVGVSHEHGCQQRVKTQHGLELFDAASGVGADRVVREADDAAPGRDEVVLAQPVVGESLAAAVVGEPVELERPRCSAEPRIS